MYVLQTVISEDVHWCIIVFSPQLQNIINCGEMLFDLLPGGFKMLDYAKFFFFTSPFTALDVERDKKFWFLLFWC